MNQKLFHERQQRIDDVVALREPDCVPIFYYSMFWHGRYNGMTCKESMYDYERLGEATLKVARDFQPDAVAPPFRNNALGPAMELMDYRQLRWPGRGVDENHSYQYIDAEYMKASEYDEYLADPTGFYLHKYLPRVAGIFEPLAKLPLFPSLHHTRTVGAMLAFADPEVERALLRMIETGKEMARMNAVAARTLATLTEMGFPLAQSAVAPSPYDLFSDYFRGSKGCMLDMFRNKGKLLAVIERVTPFIIESAITAAAASTCKIVFMPMHWGLDGFMSPEQFKTFFWPGLRQVLVALIDVGLTPLVLWEGDVTSRLEIIRDIPAGKAIYWFERTDLALAKKLVGDVACLRGNVPASLINTGTPEEVKDCCKRMIDVAGEGGGFILDGSIGIPDEAPVENVAAMFEATREYGRYR